MKDKEKIRAEIKELYNSIELCISGLVKGRTEHDDVQVANAHHKMESLMVQTQQVLSCVSDTFEESTSKDLEEAAREYAHEQGLKQITGKWQSKEAVDFQADHGLYFNIDIINAFKAGANWQKEQMIDKACEWLSNLPIEDMTYKYDDFDSSEGWYKFIEDFRKAMEE